jgi:carbon storage regulator
MAAGSVVPTTQTFILLPATAKPNKEGVSMLVLTRGQNQTIVINGNIRVTVLALKGDKIRLGISAPDDVRVDREEVHTRLIEGGLNDSRPTRFIVSRSTASAK